MCLYFVSYREELQYTHYICLGSDRSILISIRCLLLLITVNCAKASTLYPHMSEIIILSGLGRQHSAAD